MVNLQSEAQSTPASPAPRVMRGFAQVPREFMTSSPHAEIIAKGIPENAEKPYKGQTTVLPKTPFIVYNTEGIRSKLTFESDAIWMESDDNKQERIFFSDIRGNVIQEMPKYEKSYVALCLSTTYGKRWYYFIPAQYTQLLSGIMGP